MKISHFLKKQVTKDHACHYVSVWHIYIGCLAIIANGLVIIHLQGYPSDISLITGALQTGRSCTVPDALPS